MTAPTTAGPHRTPWRRLAWVAVAAAYACVVAETSPFTVGASLATALPLVVAVGAAAMLATRHRPSPRAGGAVDGARLWPWWVAIATVAAWELLCFAASPRHSHPTLSSMYDSASRWWPAKAAVCLGWLALGRAVVRRFGEERR